MREEPREIMLVPWKTPCTIYEQNMNALTEMPRLLLKRGFLLNAYKIALVTGRLITL
jgi:hypothetical protein